MMLDREGIKDRMEALAEKLRILDAAAPCSVSAHGSKHLLVCGEPGCEAIRCEACPHNLCQCWNDD